MITKENKTEKICSFYASDYHLEMILIPYINRKLNEQANLKIVTERDLKRTIQEVISKINLPQNRKKEILNLNWENNEYHVEQITSNAKESIVFIIGNIDFIEKTNKKIESEKEVLPNKIIDCYNIEEAGESITEIVLKHSKLLNTTDEKEIK